MVDLRVTRLKAKSLREDLARSLDVVGGVEHGANDAIEGNVVGVKSEALSPRPQRVGRLSLLEEQQCLHTSRGRTGRAVRRQRLGGESIV